MSCGGSLAGQSASLSRRRSRVRVPSTAQILNPLLWGFKISAWTRTQQHPVSGRLSETEGVRDGGRGAAMWFGESRRRESGGGTKRKSRPPRQTYSNKPSVLNACWYILSVSLASCCVIVKSASRAIRSRTL